MCRCCIVINPSGHVVVTEIEQATDILLPHYGSQHLGGRQVFVLIVHTPDIICKRDDTAKLLHERATEAGALQQLIDPIVESGISKTNAFANQVVQIRFEIVLGKRSFDVIAQMLEEFLPVDSSQIGEVEDGFKIFSDFQESDIIEAEGTVRNNTLKLLAQRLNILRGLQQIAAPVESS